jgi:hypothetical protein
MTPPQNTSGPVNTNQQQNSYNTTNQNGEVPVTNGAEVEKPNNIQAPRVRKNNQPTMTLADKRRQRK